MLRSLPLIVLVLLSPAASSAQVQSRPTDAPIVTAEREPWYANGDPVQFAGSVYYRAGAAVFFDGNRMIRTGSFNGVPLYADTTIEPFSLVFVPIGRGLMQPYERPRSGDLAGTVGSRAPSFPVSALPTGWGPPMAPIAPTNLEPVPLGESVALPVNRSGRALANAEQNALDEEGEPPARPSQPAATPEDIQSARERVWVEFRGQKWIPAGQAIPLAGSGLVKTGDYVGFPVYAAQGNSAETRIYLPALAGLVTPYDLKR
jgi:hypothetical protein